MSQETVDAARGMWDAFNRRDLDAWLEGFDPEVEWHAAREDPDAGVHHGRVSCGTRNSGPTRTTTCGSSPWRSSRPETGREYFDRAEAVGVAGLPPE
jgi:hypothetical protein